MGVLWVKPEPEVVEVEVEVWKIKISLTLFLGALKEKYIKMFGDVVEGVEGVGMAVMEQVVVQGEVLVETLGQTVLRVFLVGQPPKHRVGHLRSQELVVKVALGRRMVPVGQNPLAKMLAVEVEGEMEPLLALSQVLRGMIVHP